MKKEELIKKILKKINTGKIDSNSKFDEIIKLDFAANIKWDYEDNKSIIHIHDVPIAKEMIQRYSDGMNYKTADAVEGINTEFSPISMYHPNKLFNQMSDDEKEELLIGWTERGYFKDSKKYTDIFLFVDKLNTTTMSMIEDNKSIDVSIGFDVEYDMTPGEFNGEKYDIKQTKITLDHTAILPNGTGRASFPDGVGIGADSNKNKRGEQIMSEDKLVDKMQELADAQSELKDATTKANDLQKKADEQDKTIADLNKKVTDKRVKELEKDSADLKIIKDKAEEDSKAKVTELKDKILKVRNDDKIKALIEKMDAKQLEILLDEMDSSSKKLPVKKDAKDNKSVDDSNEHLADKAFRESYEKKTGQKLRRG